MCEIFYNLKFIFCNEEFWKGVSFIVDRFFVCWL
jgi:hypothetical protein